MAYSEYPKFMKHPQHRAAVISKDTVNRDGTITKAAPGSPERFPDVLVHNKDQEIDYASKGYVPTGTSDPEAYLRAISGNDELDAHKHHEYPKWVYQAHDDGEHEVDVEGETVYVKGVLVETEAAFKKLKGEWHPNPGAAAQATLEEEQGETFEQGGAVDEAQDQNPNPGAAAGEQDAGGAQEADKAKPVAKKGGK